MKKVNSIPAIPQRRILIGIYVLFLIGWCMHGLGWMLSVFPGIGVIMAYLVRKYIDDIGSTHIQYQIRTFWLSVLYGSIALILATAVSSGVGTGAFSKLHQLRDWGVNSHTGMSAWLQSILSMLPVSILLGLPLLLALTRIIRGSIRIFNHKEIPNPKTFFI